MRVLPVVFAGLVLGLSTSVSLADKHKMEVEFRNDSSITVYYAGSDASPSNPDFQVVEPGGKYNDKWTIDKCDYNDNGEDVGMTVGVYLSEDFENDQIGSASYTYLNKPNKHCHLAFDSIKMYTDDYQLYDDNVSGGVRKLTLKDAD